MSVQPSGTYPNLAKLLEPSLRGQTAAWRRGLLVEWGRGGPTLHHGTSGLIGCGWALLVLRLMRQLLRRGCQPAHLPYTMFPAAGGGTVDLIVPIEAPFWVYRRVLATHRLARRCCEICLRSPVQVVLPEEIEGLRRALHVCDWHLGALATAGAVHGLRRDAWNAIHECRGPLRAWLLGARLTPEGVEAAVRTFVAATPLPEGEAVGVMPDHVAYALSRTAPATLAGVSAEVLRPLLSDECSVLRVAAIAALSLARDSAVVRPPAAHDGEVSP